MSDSAETTSAQSPEDIAAQVEARIREENELLPPPADTPDAASVIDSDLVRSCLANNERGDGILYSIVHRDKFIYVKKSQEWLKFSGHYWETDVYQEYLRAVEAVAITYKDEADKLQGPIGRLSDRLVEQKAAAKLADEQVKELDKKIAKALKQEEPTAEAEAARDIARTTKQQCDEQTRGTAIELGKLLTEQKAFHRRIDRLRNFTGATRCADWSHIVERPLAITGDELDQQPWLLPCKNGILDLQTGELRQGKPSDWLSKAIPVEYAGFHEPCPEWEKFLASIQPDEEIRKFLAPLMGYSITGHSIEQFIAVFIGPGRNGKGLFFEILEMILGPLYWTIQAEMLLESKAARSSAGASPDIVALKGRRIAAASETDQGRRISCARVKELTGSDTLNARLLYDKHDTNFRPTHTLFLRTNNVPEGLTKDFALRERLLYINFPFRFVDNPAEAAEKDPNNAAWFRPKDRGLKDRLIKELPGILSWLVRGCAEWIAAGKLDPPQSIRQAVADLHQAEDHVGRFIAEQCEPADAGYWETFNSIYTAFCRWYCDDQCIDIESKTGKQYIPTAKTVSRELKTKGYHSPDKLETSGQKRIYGLKVVAS